MKIKIIRFSLHILAFETDTAKSQNKPSHQNYSTVYQGTFVKFQIIEILKKLFLGTEYRNHHTMYMSI
jgi:hypothetical protein